MIEDSAYTESCGPIYSELAAEPLFRDLVTHFAREIPARVQTMQTLAQERDWPALAALAHQFKGTVGTYGFHEVTLYALRLESAARAAAETAALAALEELHRVCGRVRPDTAPGLLCPADCGAKDSPG
jgi:HPt (histidine-containing phosphotransfer) domain-containing protein